MTPSARVQTAIEMLDAVIASAHRGGAAADAMIADGFRARRYAGSGDRRAIRDLVYRAIRTCGPLPASGRAAMVALARRDAAEGNGDLADAFDGSPYGPAVIAEDEPGAECTALPGWLAPLIPVQEAAALLDRAPLDLRVNRLRGAMADVQAAFPAAHPIPALPDALRLTTPEPVERSEAWANGLFEIQDAGSQHVALACQARPGMTVIDLCAGGGGKTLAIAAEMAGPRDPDGRLIACDTDRRRLAALPPRAVRAGAVVETRLIDGGREAENLADLRAAADVVLVDAPCSGTGTLRRNPEVRWRLSPERVRRLAATQGFLLSVAAPLVKPGGALIYAVCSILDAEGPDPVADFLATHPDWTATPPWPTLQGRPAGPGWRLTPAHDGCDGFFIARLMAPC